MKKRLSLLTVLVMILSLLPLSAFATANVVVSVADVAVSENETDLKNVSFNLRFTDGSIVKDDNGGKFRLEFTNATVKAATLTPSDTAGFNVASTFEGNLIFGTVTGDNLNTSNVNIGVNLQLYVPTEGDVLVRVVDEDNTGIGNLADQRIAVVKYESAIDLDIKVKDAAKAISFDGGELSQFEIRNLKAVNAANRTLEITLDNDGARFKAAPETKVLVDGVVTPATISGNKITFTNTQLNNGNAKSVIIIPVIEGLGRKATEGDVAISAAVVETSGTTQRSVTSNSATIGKIVDFSVTLTVVENGKREIPSVWGGEKARVKVTLKGPKGSFNNRDIDFKVDGASVTFIGGPDFKGERASNDNTKPEYNLFKDAEFSYKPASPADLSTAEKVEFVIELVTDADKDGVVTITAAQRGWEQKADAAKVTPKFQIAAVTTQVKKGERKNAADVTLTEAKAGLLAVNDKIKLHFTTRSSYVAFAAKLTQVEATNGLKLDLDNIDYKSADGTYVEYRVTKRSSKEPAVITFKDVRVLVDGSATDSTVQLRASLNGDLVHKIDYITVVKEYALGANKSVFTIGSTSYKVDEVEKSLQVAPYIKNGRTMLPIRAIAEALGLTVQWNPGTKTATFSDATKTAAVVIGQEIIYVNGTPIKLNAKAELIQGTTFVELKSLASAFGVDIKWDNAAKTATVSR